MAIQTAKPALKVSGQCIFIIVLPNFPPAEKRPLEPLGLQPGGFAI